MTKPKLGATGEFPDGKCHDNDEGELRLTCGVTEDGTIILDFGKSVAWLGFRPDDVDGLIEVLKKNAAIARGLKG